MFNPEKIPDEPNPNKEVNLEAYGGRVIEKDGDYFTTEGMRLSLGASEDVAELFVAEGEDAGTRLMKDNEEDISSGI